MKKPFGAKAHCLIDYGFVAIQTLLPSILGLNKKTVRRSQALGLGVLALNGFTKSPVAIKGVIPFKRHGYVDYATLGALALLTATKDIRQDKKALAFHLGFLALATANVLLTDWDDDITGKAGWEVVVTETN